MKLRPLGDRVLLKIEKAESKSPGGIIIPDIAKKKLQTGIVVAIGGDTGAIVEVREIKVGEKVMFDQYAGTTVEIDKEDHLIVKIQDIIAVVE